MDQAMLMPPSGSHAHSTGGYSMSSVCLRPKTGFATAGFKLRSPGPNRILQRPKPPPSLPQGISRNALLAGSRTVSPPRSNSTLNSARFE